MEPRGSRAGSRQAQAGKTQPRFITSVSVEPLLSQARVVDGMYVSELSLQLSDLFISRGGCIE